MKKQFLIGVVVVILLVIPLVASAQEELDATFVASDGSFSFDYPSDWIASEDDEDGSVMIYNGDQFVMLYSPAVLDSYGLGDLTDPADAAKLLQTTLAEDYDTGKVEVFSLEGRDAARFLYEDDEVSGMYLFVAFSEDTLGMINALSEEKLDVFTVQAIAVTFDGGSGGSGSGSGSGASGTELSLSEYDSGYRDVIDELRGLGMIDAFGGDLVFTEDYAWFEGQGAFYTPLARRTDRANFVMSAELTYRPSDAEDLETCTLGMHVVWTGNSANEYLDVGYTNYGTIFWWDISDNDDLIYGEVEGPDVTDSHVFTIVMVDGELTVFVDGELMFYQDEVEDRAGSWGVGLTGRGPGAKCEARDIWVYDLP